MWNRALLIAGWMVLTLLQPAQAQDLLRGAAGIAWETSIDTLQGLEETARSGDVRYYRRSGDFYSIAGITLNEVVYGFYKGRYFAAFIPVSSAADFNKIKSHLEQRYGDPRAHLRVDRTIYIWEYVDAKIKLKQYQDHPVAKLAFYFMPLSTLVNQARSGDQTDRIYHLDELAPDYDF